MGFPEEQRAVPCCHLHFVTSLSFEEKRRKLGLSPGILGTLPSNAVCVLLQEMEKEIKNVFRGGNQDEVLSEAFRLTITRKDIQTLNNLNWLNDEVRGLSEAGEAFFFSSLK